MPAEHDDRIIVVPLEPVGGRPPADDDTSTPTRPRRGWWLAVAVVLAVGVAVVVASLQIGTDPVDDDTVDEPAAEDDEAAEVSDGSPPEEPREPEQSETETAAGDEAGLDGEPETEPTGLFGEPEHPVSGIEPYVPSRVRPVELGPPAEVCLGTLAATRIQLPLRFASSKPEGIEDLTWSPDCRRMVFRIGNSLWLADGDGTGDMPFLTAQHGLSAPVWSPDSQWIAFSQNAITEGERSSHIQMVLPDGLGLAQITHGVVLDRDPTWSPDESRIAFARRVRVTEEDGSVRFVHRIVVVDLRSGAEQVVASSAEPVAAPSWAPDGGAIAFRVGGELRARRLDDPSHFTLMVGVVGRGSWTADGSRVAAFRDWFDGRATIVVSDLPGIYPGDQHVISVQGIEQASPRTVPALQWSADGQRLFFHDSDTPTSHWAYSIVVPRPTRSPEYWAMLDVVETVVHEVGYAAVAVQHSVDAEAEFSVRGRDASGAIEVWIAFERSEPRRIYETVENPHSALAGIRRGPDRIGVWFTCDDIYGEVLAASLQAADTIAATLMSAACPAPGAMPSGQS